MRNVCTRIRFVGSRDYTYLRAERVNVFQIALKLHAHFLNKQTQVNLKDINTHIGVEGKGSEETICS